MRKRLSYLFIAAATAIFLGLYGEAAYAANEYNETYGEQLSSENSSRLIYDAMVDEYLYQAGDTGNEDGRYTGLAQAGDYQSYPLWVELVDQNITISLASKTTAQIESERDEWIETTVNQLMSDVTAAYDAFMKDYPQVFWMYSINTSLSYDVVVYGTDMTLSVKYLIITPDQYVVVDSDFITEFNDNVIAAYENVKWNYTVNETSMDSHIAKAIHDYIIRQVDYNYDEAAISTTDTGSFAYTAAPVFMEDIGCENVVCEGYAKAFKILCDKFGVSNAILTGLAVDEAGMGTPHMWNAIKLENNNWYAVDVTWDDQSHTVYYNYFLAGQNSEGYYNYYKNDHFTETTFSSFDYSVKFAIPQVATNGYYEKGVLPTREMEKANSTVNTGSASEVEVTTAMNITVVDTKTNGKVAVTEKNNKVSEKKNTVTEKKQALSKVAIKKATVKKIKVQRLKNKKACKPKVTVIYNGQKLKKNVDYTVTYKNNKRKGTGKVIIKGKGKFKGKKVVKFRII